MVGVATKKSQAFYQQQEEKGGDQDEGTSSEAAGTQYMKAIPNVQNKDVIGVAVQQSDLPMIQFTLNGEPLHELAMNRFRGDVYPSIYLPTTIPGGDDENDSSALQVELIMNESKFQHLSPGPRFGPVIVARSIV